MRKYALPRLLATSSGGPLTRADIRPDVIDVLILGFRPSGRCIGTLRVGPTRTYTTIGAAIAAATTLQTATAASEGVALGPRFGHPDYRVDILIDPGVYAESVTTARDVGLYCATGVLGDVVVTGSAAVGRLGCLISHGGCYVESIVFERDTISGAAAADLPKYPQHHSSDNNGRLSSFVNCVFHSKVVHPSGGWTPVGMDGSNGGTALWYGCTFSADGGTSVYINLHGAGANTVPGTYMVIDPTAPGIEVRYDALNAAIADALWVAGGNVGSIQTIGAGTVLHHDPTSTTGAVTAAGSSDTSTAWPTPVGGLSAAERAFYYPWL